MLVRLVCALLSNKMLQGPYLMSHQHSHFKVRRAECPVPGDHIGPAACNWRAPGDTSSHPTPSETWEPAVAPSGSTARLQGKLRLGSWQLSREPAAGSACTASPLLGSLSGPQTCLQQCPHCALNTCRGCWWHLAVHSVGAPPRVSACSSLALMVCLSCALGQLQPQL